MVLIIYKSRKTDSLVGASPSGKAPGFGPGISEVRILPPQNNKMRVERLSFFMRKERTGEGGLSEFAYGIYAG